jgi:hypothetical protein
VEAEAVMARYYTADVHDGEAGTTSVVVHPGMVWRTAAAAGVHVEGLPESPFWRRAVLLDYGSVDLADEAAFRVLLETDPLIREAYDRGRADGQLAPLL